jgi:hypothetical protein
MNVVSVSARQVRSRYRHELRTLAYVTVDDGNGGIIRNLSHEGLSVQAVARLRPEQQVRLRFELRSPRLRVEAHGQVSWSTASGQCGIRFVELPARTACQIDEWIFANLLDALARAAANERSMFGAAVVSIARDQEDGLIVSAAPRAAIRLEPSARVFDAAELEPGADKLDEASPVLSELNWLSRPLSGRTIAWMVDGLVLIAAVLLFSLTFLSITHELPPWQITLCAAFVAGIFIAGTYWFLFSFFGRASLGARLARVVSGGAKKR